MLPALNSNGELPEGVHRAALDEVLARFGVGSNQRLAVADRLRRIWKVASSTGGLDRAVVFGSFVTDEPEPNDVDVILVMTDDFEVTTGSAEVKALFDHQRANRKYGASVFWIRRSLLISETLESFIAHWQVKRGGGRRGIVEIHHD